MQIAVVPSGRPKLQFSRINAKFDGGLLHLHEADEAAVDWLTTYGS